MSVGEICIDFLFKTELPSLVCSGSSRCHMAEGCQSVHFCLTSSLSSSLYVCVLGVMKLIVCTMHRNADVDDAALMQ